MSTKKQEPKIIRTPTKLAGGITPEEKVRLEAHAKKWIANALSTAPADPVPVDHFHRLLYKVADLKAPKLVLLVPSPRIMAFAASCTAAVEYARQKVAGTPSTAKGLLIFDGEKFAVEGVRQPWACTVRDDRTVDIVCADIAAAIMWTADQMSPQNPSDPLRQFGLPDGVIPRLRILHMEPRPDFKAICALVADNWGVDLEFIKDCCRNWWRTYSGGNMWGGWDSYLTALRDVLGLRLPVYEKYAAWEGCALNAGFRMVHENFCIVSDRPDVLRIDGQNRPHNLDGPSHRWRDGWALYFVNGVRIAYDKRYIVEDPSRITWQEIDREQNSEIRRAMIERYGADRYVLDSGAKVVHTMPADHPIVGLRTARLLRKEVPEDEPIVMIDLLNSTPEPDGTVKRYMLRVDPNAYGGKAGTDCHAAAASTWRIGVGRDAKLAFPNYKDYRPSAES